METALVEDEQATRTPTANGSTQPDTPQSRARFRLIDLAKRVASGIAFGAEWLLGLASLVVGLSTLAALPLLQFLSLGYLLESSARVARTGRMRDGFIGVRLAARIGGVAAASWLSLVPAWLVGSYARSAELIDPGGPVARNWRIGLVLVTALSLFHIAVSCTRGGRLRYFLWPLGNPFWLVRRLRQRGLYVEVRDGFWAFVGRLRIPYYFHLGLVGFLGTLAWLAVPGILIGATGKFPLLAPIGALLLAVIVPFLPFLQVRYALEGRFAALFSRRAIRDRFRRAPWAFAFSLLVLLLAAIPLYLLKIEMIPREAAWLPSLVFVIFLAPARLLTGWAYARAGRRDRPRHWIFRVIGRIAIIPIALLYVLVVFLGQYTSWGGVSSLYEQHAFLLPVPFFSM
jgi:hypothetical protein